jgi:glycosyltransferase 2 family protein
LTDRWYTLAEAEPTTRHVVFFARLAANSSMSTETSIRSATVSQALPWSRWLGRAVATLTLVMGLYLGATVWAVRGDLARAIGMFPASVLPGTIGLVLLGLALRAVRWHYYTLCLRWPVPWLHSVVAFLASFAFTATPGKAGELIKSVLLRTRYDVSLSDGFGVLLVERLGDLLAVLVLASGGLGLLADATVYFLATAVVIAATTLFVSNRWIYYPILSQVGRVRKLSGIVHRLLRALDTGRALLRPIPFLFGVGIAVIAWGCEGLAFHLVLRGFGLEMEILESFSIYGVATLVGALSALPGGLGSFEVVMVLLLSRLGIPVATATLPVVVFRLCSLWLGSLIGLIFMFGWLWLVGPGDAHASSRGLE